jgi:hypothetical protein
MFRPEQSTGCGNAVNSRPQSKSVIALSSGMTQSLRSSWPNEAGGAGMNDIDALVQQPVDAELNLTVGERGCDDKKISGH